MSITASIHKNKRTSLERIEKFISKEYFSDVNLYSQIYKDTVPVSGLYHWVLPSPIWQDFSFDEIKEKPFTPTSLNTSYGPTWATHWFKVELEIPQAWQNQEIHFCWNSSSEAMIWDIMGNPIQSVSGSPDFQSKEEVVISNNWLGTSPKFTYYVEMACSTMFGAGKGGMIAPTDEKATFLLKKAELCVFNRSIYNLLVDLDVMHDMAKALDENYRAYDAIYAANQMINLIQAGKNEEAANISTFFFSKRNGDCAHTLMAMGHCHIDTAWLWPYSETIRKCGRSWISVVNLMDNYPNLVFTCSQAQQFSWVQLHYPGLFDRIKTYVRAGRFVPVGGTWVEMDGNLPSGESFIRQFLYGQKYFQNELGVKCQEFWLPDTFGYSAQIPQILNHVGMKYFLTQKLSWNLVNKFPHHTFWWQGIDGSQVLAHFPPGDSYEMKCHPSEAVKTITNLQDKGRVTASAFLFGYGDGGGGPTALMLDRCKRLEDLDGIPKMTMSTPQQLFSKLHSEGNQLCHWVGELYLELHNGTYTSQAAIKSHNHECEQLLHAIEMVAARLFSTHSVQAEMRIYQDSIEDFWKVVLLHQFHDVLPGTSIQKVYEDVENSYRNLKIENLLQKGLHLMLNGTEIRSKKYIYILNVLPWAFSVPIIAPKEQFQNIFSYQTLDRGNCYVLVDLEPSGLTLIQPRIEVRPVAVIETSDGVWMENHLIKVFVNRVGQVTSLQSQSKKATQFFSNGRVGNQLVIFDDIPLFWDAWDTMDYHLETRSCINIPEATGLAEIKLCQSGPLVATVKWSSPIGKSSNIIQFIKLKAETSYVEFETFVEWKENRKFLKVEFQTDIKSPMATYGIQFGHLQRPTHINTSFDMAQFEVCGHRWADLSEYNVGLAVLSNNKYGWNIRDGVIRLSLLRAPKSPDPTCDMGEHLIMYALMPHEGSFQEAGVNRTSYEFMFKNLAENFYYQCSEKSDASNLSNWFTVEDAGVMLETIKPAYDNLKQIVIRLYESFGRRVTTRIKSSFAMSRVHECNGLEEVGLEVCLDSPSTFTAYFKSFQIRSYVITLQ